MAEATSSQVEIPDIRQVPQDRAVRDAVREAAAARAADLDQSRPPRRQDFEDRATSILDALSLPPQHFGFAMVAVSNAFWRSQFEATRFRRRLLFLPNCLRDREVCQGRFDAQGLLHCVGCSDCVIHDLKTAAEQLGYRVLIFEGTPPVLTELMKCSSDALLGVACLESLERAFDKVRDLGVPSIAVPLLNNGCANTVAEVDQVLSFLSAERPPQPVKSRSYAPLLRASAALFEPEDLTPTLESVGAAPDGGSLTDPIAMDWITAGGKRFRPFVTLAGYAVARHGTEALRADTDLRRLIPLAVKRVAVAIEALHKASLVHDDIEDDDAFRYGRQTVHRAYGTGPAINVGDYLVGLGYRLIAAQAEPLGADCVADILAHLSGAHLELCRGQGDELLWPSQAGRTLRPIDALSIYARKTAPAFETALYAGLRAADATVDRAALSQFALYLGEAYQVRNDLDDWQHNEDNKRLAGLDAQARRPTLLRAFAIEAGAADALAAAEGDLRKIRELYERHGVFDKADHLADKLRDRAVALAEHTEDPALRDLLLFIVRIVL